MILKKKLKSLLDYCFGVFGFSLIRKTALKSLMESVREAREYRLLKNYPGEIRDLYLKYRSCSRSQLNQDLFVLAETGFRKNGYFVEVGATDGVDLSNTYLLEKKFGWRGILVEPANYWYPDITENRESAIVKKCVWNKSGEHLKFLETDQKAVSTIQGFGKEDSFRAKREQNSIYEVESVSLCDLLAQHNAPAIIDYLSIDTEGSEFEILNAFPFEKYIFKVITVEHNFSSKRDQIFRLLKKNGYKRRYTELSEFDDWYVYEGDLKAEDSSREYPGAAC